MRSFVLQRRLRLRRAGKSRTTSFSNCSDSACAFGWRWRPRISERRSLASAARRSVAEAALEFHIRRHRIVHPAGLLVDLAGQERGFGRRSRAGEVDDDLTQIGERLLVQVVGELRLRDFEQLRRLRVSRRGGRDRRWWRRRAPAWSPA